MRCRSSALKNANLSQFRRYAAALCSAALLSACGGGGGTTPATSGNPVIEPPVVPPVTTDFPVASVMTAFVQSAHTYDLTGTLAGQLYTFTDAYIPQATTSTFEGKQASAALQTTTIKRAGTVISVSKSNLFFTANPYVQLGSTDADSGAYTVITQTANLPTSAKIGQTGPIGTGIDYTNSTKTTVSDTATITWSLEADTGGNALLCIVNQVPGSAPLTGYECLRIDTAGKVLGRVIKVNSGGVTTIFN